MNRWRALFWLVAIMWAVEGVNMLTGHRLNGLGLEPRTLVGLPGIFVAPFLHGDLAHLLSNTAGLAVLGALVSIKGEQDFLIVTAFVIVLGGMATWALGRPGDHVGASALVFGYFGFLIGRGWTERTPLAVVIAAAVTILYGGLLIGVVPNSRGISWEGHLFGLIAGFAAARWRITDPAPSS